MDKVVYLKLNIEFTEEEFELIDMYKKMNNYTDIHSSIKGMLLRELNNQRQISRFMKNCSKEQEQEIQNIIRKRFLEEA